jgi:hypothetical protein
LIDGIGLLLISQTCRDISSLSGIRVNLLSTLNHTPNRILDFSSGILNIFAMYGFSPTDGPEPLTAVDCNTRPINSGWLTAFQRRVKRSNRENALPGKNRGGEIGSPYR